MGMITNWFDKISRYTYFKSSELNSLLLSIAVIAFIISFRNWGVGKEIDFSHGIVNLIGAMLIVSISLTLRLLFQKIVALGADLQAEYKLWSIGLFIALILGFITNGLVWFIVPGSIVMNFMPGHRIGWLRYSLNYFGIGVISLAGPIANIFLAMIFRTLYDITSIQLFHAAFLLNIIMALWNMLPIPPADGSRIFFGSRLVYMFGTAVVVSSAILLYANINIIVTIIASVLLGWLWWLIYYIVWERFNWGKGPWV